MWHSDRCRPENERSPMKDNKKMVRAVCLGLAVLMLVTIFSSMAIQIAYLF